MDTEPVFPRKLDWFTRFAIYALVGVLTFVTQPPGATAIRAQFIGYLVAGVALVTGTVLGALRPGSRALPALTTVVSVAGGFTAGAGQHENNCAILITAMAAAGAAYHFSPRVAWAVLSAGIAAFEANVLIYQDGMAQFSAFLTQPLGPVSALFFGMLLRSRRVQAEQSRALLAEQHRADVLGERTRIAREIHDVLAHSLGALGIQIQTARAVLTDQEDIAKAVEILMTAQKMATEGLNETRQAVHALRADIRSLNDELDRVTGTYGERYHVGVTFDVGGDPRPLSPEATVTLLRTAQEALVNAAKHAAGQDVAVRLEYGGHDVRLTVVNSLSACPVPIGGTVNGGYGLTGMRERVRLLNGTLETGPRDGRWTVAASIPLVAA
jgi:signal transduction histidine kinase